ncbi:MAG: PGPGW domain-containing protein [Actinomycetota bacterium]|nr:PGPGW domain-containing protein [Actinomycetota bacterium]
MTEETDDRRRRRAEPKLVRKLRDRQASHRERGTFYRAAFVIAGVVILLTGVAMLALPGPAFVVIPIGLAILALEFTWAERLLETALEKAADAQEKAADTSPLQKALGLAAGGLAIAAFVFAAVTWDIPVLPV